ncbi:MAG: hypothetical protein GY798_20385 [Hyphomicrobiales bacterium]|nr:hypothetical protein [Hyphomicrobiales bacterium]
MRAWVVLAVLFATPVVAGERLFEHGAYGAEAACEYRAIYGVGNGKPLGLETDPPFIFLPDEIVGIDWGCTYTSISEEDNDGWINVIAACGGGDDYWTDNLAIQFKNGEVSIFFEDHIDKTGQMSPFRLPYCFDSPSQG